MPDHCHRIGKRPDDRGVFLTKGLLSFRGQNRPHLPKTTIRQHAVSARWNGQHRIIFVTAGTGERGQKEHQCKNPFGLQIGRLDPVPVAIVSD